MEEKYPHAPLTLKQYISNVWYYYKWLIITGVIFLTFIIVCIVQSVSMPDYDARVIYVGPHTLSNTTCEKIRNSCAEVMTDDINGDGKKNIDLKTINLSTDYDLLIGNEKESDSQYNSLIDYNNEMLSGDYCIMLLDPYFYNELKSSNVLQELPNMGGIYGAPLSKLRIRFLEGFSDIPEDTVLAIRFPAKNGKVTDEELEKIYQDNYIFMMNLLYYEGK